MPPANTTLPKPPIYDKDGQPWLEACSADGKVYYFNAKTRETKWEKPDMAKPEETTEEKKDDDKVNRIYKFFNVILYSKIASIYRFVEEFYGNIVSHYHY